MSLPALGLGFWPTSPLNLFLPPLIHDVVPSSVFVAVVVVVVVSEDAGNQTQVCMLDRKHVRAEVTDPSLEVNLSQKSG